MLNHEVAATILDWSDWGYISDVAKFVLVSHDMLRGGIERRESELWVKHIEGTRLVNLTSAYHWSCLPRRARKWGSFREEYDKEWMRFSTADKKLVGGPTHIQRAFEQSSYASRLLRVAHLCGEDNFIVHYPSCVRWHKDEGCKGTKDKTRDENQNRERRDRNRRRGLRHRTAVDNRNLP